MAKKFYRYALWSVFGFATVSILFSLIYFFCEEYIDSGSTVLAVMYYIKLILDLAATFVGFGTIIYATTKLGWLHGLACGGIYFCTIIMYAIYQTATLTSYSSDLTYVDEMVSDNIVDLITFNAFYSMGQLFITFAVPAAILVYLCYRYIKKDDSKFERYVSFKNPVQKTMGIFCILMAIINFVAFLFSDVLAFLVQEEFYIYRSEFWALIVQSLITILEMSLVYILVQYIAFLLVFKMYDHFIAGNSVVENKRK